MVDLQQILQALHLLSQPPPPPPAPHAQTDRQDTKSGQHALATFLPTSLLQFWMLIKGSRPGLGSAEKNHSLHQQAPLLPFLSQHSSFPKPITADE